MADGDQILNWLNSLGGQWSQNKAVMASALPGLVPANATGAAIQGSQGMIASAAEAERNRLMEKQQKLKEKKGKLGQSLGAVGTLGGAALGAIFPPAGMSALAGGAMGAGLGGAAGGALGGLASGTPVMDAAVNTSDVLARIAEMLDRAKQNYQAKMNSGSVPGAMDGTPPLYNQRMYS